MGFRDKCPWDVTLWSLQSLETLSLAFKQLTGSLEETLTTLFLNAGCQTATALSVSGSLLRLESGKHLCLSVEESKKQEDKCVYKKKAPPPHVGQIAPPWCAGCPGPERLDSLLRGMGGSWLHPEHKEPAPLRGTDTSRRLRGPMLAKSSAEQARGRAGEARVPG